MELIKQIEADYITAFKAKDEIGKAALGNLKAALKNAELDKKSVLNDTEALSVVAKKVKQHKDSITEFEKGGRADLVATEQAQMQVLAKYLPKQMDESEVRKLVQETIEQLQAKPSDFGKVMKQVLSKAAGATDGNVVSKIVKEELK